ncbi:YkyA family protein [Corticicoccus populi]|uniref:YkyA family protein n=1 Tax=Corticicoccus populi TaxID=1812821 RepID=A0ABW5WSU2_9STAP
MKKIFITLSMMVIVLIGCSNDTEELKEFYNEFQETVRTENGLSDVTDKFNTLEEERSDLQDDLAAADMGEINEISTALIENADKRLELIDEEEEIMQESKETAENANDAFEMISNESYIIHAESLISAADDRYDAHAELIDQLRVTLNAEKSVFEFLNEEEVTQDGIDEEINALNEEYGRLETLQNDLNTSTERVNELKGEIRTLIDES